MQEQRSGVPRIPPCSLGGGVHAAYTSEILTDPKIQDLAFECEN